MREMIAVLDGINPSASSGGNYSGGSSWAPNFPLMPSSEGLAGYLDAFEGGAYDIARVNPSASSGGNYSGGSSWAPNFPTMPSSEGLANYEITSVNPSASGGANYSGGSSWAPGFPLMPSSEGLARIATRGALHGLTSMGVAPDRAVALARAVKGRASGATPCDLAYNAAFRAARAGGFDPQFARAAASRAAGRCAAEGWAAFATKA